METDELQKSKNALKIADDYRKEKLPEIIKELKSELGQFMTPSVIAQFMAGFFSNLHSIDKIKILDPGAGVGSLSAALVEKILISHKNIKSINLNTFEIDPKLKNFLVSVLSRLEKSVESLNIEFNQKISVCDFIEKASFLLSDEMFEVEKTPSFSHIILNPPYKKIGSKSKHRLLLRKVGIETSNLYTAFLSLAIRMLEPGGEIVAITPRSFCNGSYFLPFRKDFDREMSIKKIHVFHSRNKAFKDDEVLQENIIFLAVKGGKRDRIKITSSTGIDFMDFTERDVDYAKVINPNDPNKIIHIATDDIDEHVIQRVKAFNLSYKDLGLTISTGPVVDFRLKSFLKKHPSKGTVPLLYPAHFNSGSIEWPIKEFKKSNAIIENEFTKKWLMPIGFYTVVKRFSAKEEKRRIVSSVISPNIFRSKNIGFENHLNVFHTKKNGLEELLAKGLSVWLNSSIIDMYFRQFNGNTQVNASDLKILPYPDYNFLFELGNELNTKNYLSQDEIDELIERKLKTIGGIVSINPLSAINKVMEITEILKNFNIQYKKINTLTVLIVISLLNLKPDSLWIDINFTNKDIFEIRDFIKEYYGKNYTEISLRNYLNRLLSKKESSLLRVENKDLKGLLKLGLNSDLMELFKMRFITNN